MYKRHGVDMVLSVRPAAAFAAVAYAVDFASPISPAAHSVCVAGVTCSRQRIWRCVDLLSA